MAATERLVVRAEPQDADVIREAAKKSRQSVSRWILGLCIAEIERTTGGQSGTQPILVEKEKIKPVEAVKPVPAGPSRPPGMYRAPVKPRQEKTIPVAEPEEVDTSDLVTVKRGGKWVTIPKAEYEAELAEKERESKSRDLFADF